MTQNLANFEIEFSLEIASKLQVAGLKLIVNNWEIPERVFKQKLSS